MWATCRCRARPNARCPSKGFNAIVDPQKFLLGLCPVFCLHIWFVVLNLPAMEQILAPKSKEGLRMNEQLLACLVYSGMFSDEVAVKYKSKHMNSPVSSFVPKDRVVGQPSDTESPGKLRVTVFRDKGT